ncbi:hypothetical protein [Methylosinus sp. PW1]|uniref:dCTP deaminase n=1 Tax=Methylosinus sp. PW1 TaxID=107636 RepID=UPI00056CD9C8|nr:hypothetical protein [Methylosinus sp. PW1]
MIVPGHKLPLSIVTPFKPRTIFDGMSFGMSHAGYDVRIAQDLIIWPGQFRLASTIEQFSMPLNMVGVVHDKSSWARRGLACQNTLIEPGWKGFLTLELSLHRLWPLRIKAGSPIAQIVFHLTDGTCVGYDGKYQDQPDRPVPAIMERA